MRRVVGLRKDHPQAVVRFGIAGADLKSALKSLARLIPILLQRDTRCPDC